MVYIAGQGKVAAEMSHSNNGTSDRFCDSCVLRYASKISWEACAYRGSLDDADPGQLDHTYQKTKPEECLSKTAGTTLTRNSLNNAYSKTA